MMNLQLFGLDDDKLDNFSFNYTDQVDEWGKSVGDYQVIQQSMDSRAEELRVKYNSLIDQLEALTGAGNIGAKNVLDATASDIQAELDRLYLQIMEVVSDGIAPGTPGYYLRTNLAGTSVEWSDIQGQLNPLTLGVTNNRVAIDELLAYNGVTSSVDQSDSIFYDFPNSTEQLTAGTVDLTKAYAETVTQGLNTISVTSMNEGVIADFIAGQEITLQDDASKEVLIIDSIADPIITFTSNIVNAYPSGANIYRSNLTVDGDTWKFGGFSSQETIDRATPVEVVGEAYDTSGNGGRKLVRLDDGTLVSALKDATQIKYYVSLDNGLTWNYNCYSNHTGLIDYSIVTDGSLVKAIVAYSTNVGAISFNPLEVSDGSNVSALTSYSFTLVDSSQTSLGNCSLAIAPNGDIHACWASKNASYNLSWNLRYSVSIDGALNWASVTQLTVSNLGGRNIENPSIVVMSNSNPCVLNQYDNENTLRRINAEVFDGSVWATVTVYENDTSYDQQYPSADVLSDGTIVVAWHGTDATDSTADNIRYSQSTNNGANWSSMEKLTSGNSDPVYYPSITRNENDTISIMFVKGVASSNYDLKLIQGITLSWGVEELIKDINGSATVINPSTCNNFRTFEKPLTIFSDNIVGDVEFYGKWYGGTETATTEIDIRLNIESWENVDSIASWMYSNNTANVTVDASLSVKADGGTESYTDLADTEVEIDASNNYYVASGAVATPEKLSTLKYHVTRALTTDDVEFKRIQGAVA